jgi:uncharacterized phage protein gp47/JayE
MPWATPTLRNVRELVRGEITTSLGKASFIGNSVLRVMADAQAALTHLVLRYIDWLALQLLPDTAETEWLDRHGDIWLVNADGSTGRKAATLASGTATATGVSGVTIPLGTQLSDATTTYEVTKSVVLGNVPVELAITALEAGAIGNHDAGYTLTFTASISGVDDNATVVELSGGTDVETDDELRARVLRRIQQPPMGGAAYDYEAWALAVPGCTRAWCAPLEMGIGTVTVRVLFDSLRADDDGWPTADDLAAVTAYINTKRPVAVEDFWVLAPIKQFIDVSIDNLVPDTETTRAAIEQSLRDMLFKLAAPGQTIFAAWKGYAVMETPGVQSFHLSVNTDDVMQSSGHMAVLGTITYGY